MKYPPALNNFMRWNKRQHIFIKTDNRIEEGQWRLVDVFQYRKARDLEQVLETQDHELVDEWGWNDDLFNETTPIITDEGSSEKDKIRITNDIAVPKKKKRKRGRPKGSKNK